MNGTRQILDADQLAHRFTARRRILLIRGMPRGRVVLESINTPVGSFSVYAMSHETYCDAVNRALELSGNDPRRDASWPVEQFAAVAHGMALIPVQQTPNTIDALSEATADVPYRDWAILL